MQQANRLNAVRLALLLFAARLPGNIYAQDIGSQTDEAAIKQAEAIREEFVRDFGDDTANYQFDHPGTPLYPGSVVKLQKEDVFLRVYITVYARGLGGSKGIPSPPAAKRVAGSLTWRLLQKLNLPVASDIAQGAAAARRAAGDDAYDKAAVDAEDARARGGLKNAAAVVRQILPEDASRYDSGTYLLKASLMFKAVSRIMEAQQFPTPFVVWYCDAYGSGQTVRQDGENRGGGARENMALLFPGRAEFKPPKWWSLTRVGQWRAVTGALKDFFAEGAVALADPDKAAAFARGLPTDEGPAEVTIVRAFSRDALAEYRSSPTKAAQMLEAAQVMHFGWSFAYEAMIGELKPDSTLLRQ